METIFQHAEVLALMQHYGILQPVTIQIAPFSYDPTGKSHKGVSTPWSLLRRCLQAYVKLGAKSVVLEIGEHDGDPTDYEDPEGMGGISVLIDRIASYGLAIGLVSTGGTKPADAYSHGQPYALML